MKAYNEKNSLKCDNCKSGTIFAIFASVIESLESSVLSSIRLRPFGLCYPSSLTPLNLSYNSTVLILVTFIIYVPYNLTL